MYLGLDLGTSGVKALLLDDDQAIVASATGELDVSRPHPGWSEQDPADWIAGCARCRGHLLTIAHDAGFAPKVAFETEDYVAVQGFVAAGLGVALIPDLIKDATSNPDVVIRPLSPSTHRRIHVVTTDDLLGVPAVAATVDALDEVARQQHGATTGARG